MTQYDRSIGYAKETVFGTRAVVAKHFEYTDESLQPNQTWLQAKGFRAGSVADRLNRRVKGTISPSGDITSDVNSAEITDLLEAAFGAVAKVGAGPYTRLFTPTLTDLPPTYTIQKVLPLLGGAGKQHTFTSMACGKVQINAGNGEIATVTTSWIGQDMDTSTAVVAPAYVVGGELLTFRQGCITVGGTVTMPTSSVHASGGTQVGDIRDFQVTLDNDMDSGDGFNFCGGGKRSHAPLYKLRQVTGQFTAEFDATVLRDASLDGTGLALVLTFAGAADELQIVVPKIVLDSNVPAGNSVPITQQFSFTGLEDGVNPVISAWLKNTIA